MDGSRFDAVVRTLTHRGTRRGLLALLAGLPLPVGMASRLAVETEAAGRRHRRKKRRHHQQGDGKNSRKGKQTGKEKGKDKCTPDPDAKTCAGRCAIVTNNCGGQVDCGPCTCARGCPPCQTCDAATGLCGPLADGAACNDGNACTQSDTCQSGVCTGSSPVVCTPLDACHVAGICDPSTGTCSNPKAPDDSSCGGSDRCCDGVCIPTQTDAANCGACGQACAPGQSCQGGVCGVVCGADFCPAATEICDTGTCQACTVCATCGYTTVQAAIDDDSTIPDGATIRICAGTYNESIVIDRALSFVGAGQGNGSGNTILQGTAGSTVRIFNGISMQYPVALRRLRITGGSGTAGAGVFNGIGDLTITDCTIAGNSVTDGEGGGIYNAHLAALTMNGCTLSGNSAVGSSAVGGALITHGGPTTLTNCNIGPNNTAGSQGGGIWVAHSSSGLTLDGCTVTGNQADFGGGIYIDSNGASLTNGSVTGNTATADGDDIFNSNSVLIVSGTDIGECVDDGPLACGCPGGTPC